MEKQNKMKQQNKNKEIFKRVKNMAIAFGAGALLTFGGGVFSKYKLDNNPYKNTPEVRKYESLNQAYGGLEDSYIAPGWVMDSNSLVHNSKQKIESKKEQKLGELEKSIGELESKKIVQKYKDYEIKGEGRTGKVLFGGSVLSLLLAGAVARNYSLKDKRKKSKNQLEGGDE